MKLNKCSRCGCFFVTDSEVCPNCMPKDMCDINKLKNFLEDCDPNFSIEEISCGTGISTKNLHRFFQSNELTNYNTNQFGTNPEIKL